MVRADGVEIKAGNVNEIQVRTRKCAHAKVQNYLDARVISPGEAFYKLMGMHVVEMKPKVVHLPVHLRGEQTVILDVRALALAHSAHRATMRCL